MAADEDSSVLLLPDGTDDSLDVEDSLLDLLRNHESFSEEMFLQALRTDCELLRVQRKRDLGM